MKGRVINALKGCKRAVMNTFTYTLGTREEDENNTMK